MKEIRLAHNYICTNNVSYLHFFFVMVDVAVLLTL